MTGQSGNEGREAGPGPPVDPAGASGDAPRPDPVIRDRRRVRATAKPAQPAGPEPGSPGDGGSDRGGSDRGGSDRGGSGQVDPGRVDPGQVDPGQGGAAVPAADDDAPTIGAGPAAGGLGAELAALRTDLDERTRDLQRVTADFANYRKRVDRDRALASETATANVLGALLPVLDDLDRAREHGELVEGFAAVAEQLVAATGKLGLTPFGERGDRFDPNRHEAVAHHTSAEVTEPTCVEVLRRGYLVGGRLVRPALVAVADPAPAAAPEPAEATAPADRSEPADRAGSTEPADPAETES